VDWTIADHAIVNSFTGDIRRFNKDIATTTGYKTVDVAGCYLRNMMGRISTESVKRLADLLVGRYSNLKAKTATRPTVKRKMDLCTI